MFVNEKININRFVLQESGRFVEGCLTCEELSGGLLTGDDGGGRLLRVGDSNEHV